ncbi:MAG: T9SS type A sorting domain-containing protein, partial [Bacteroidales bacterium]|nr:T9SS type A sorting domain-containing protein [Bacteroidales bacterium]
DMMGRVVYDNKLSNGQNEAITLTVEDGVYIVNLISGNGVHTEKVILK